MRGKLLPTFYSVAEKENNESRNKQGIGSGTEKAMLCLYLSIHLYMCNCQPVVSVC